MISSITIVFDLKRCINLQEMIFISKILFLVDSARIRSFFFYREHGMQDAGCGIRDAGCGMQDAGFLDIILLIRNSSFVIRNSYLFPIFAP